MAFKWTDVLVEKLIDLYEEREYLYDTTSILYYNKDARDAGITEISCWYNRNVANNTGSHRYTGNDRHLVSIVHIYSMNTKMLILRKLLYGFTMNIE